MSTHYLDIIKPTFIGKDEPLLIYHDKCTDGMACKWLFNKRWNGAKALAFNYGMPPPLGEAKDRDVIIADFSFSPSDLQKLAKVARYILVLDHHQSAIDQYNKYLDFFPDNVQIVLDMKRCGAQLMWDFLNDNTEYNWIIEMVADKDLWRWKHSWSKAVGKACFELGYLNNSDSFDKLFNECPNITSSRFSELLFLGETLEKINDKNIDQAVKNTIICNLVFANGETYRVGLANTPFHMRSDVGNAIVTRMPVDFALMYSYDFVKDEWGLSSRSDKDEFDLSKIMTKFPNGGGHSKAAGATIYGVRANPPLKYADRIGETLHTYLIKID